MDAVVSRLIQRGSPFELQDAIVQGVPCRVFPRAPLSLQHLLRRTAVLGSREFVVCGERRLTFADVFASAQGLAAILKTDYEVTRGVRVAVMLENSPEWIIAFLGIVLAGAVPVLLHTNTLDSIASTALTQSACDLVIASAARISSTQASAAPGAIIARPSVLWSQHERHGCPGAESLDPNRRQSATPQILDFGDLLRSGIADNTAHSMVDVAAHPDEVALIAFTSGTTGCPKGVVLTHRNLVTGLMNMMLGAALQAARVQKDACAAKVGTGSTQPCSMVLAPLSHIGGYAQVMLMCHIGGRIVLMPQWSAEAAAAAIAREGIRSISGASPTMIQELLDAARPTHALGSLSSLFIHGAAMLPHLVNAIRKAIPTVSVSTGYGMTETNGSVCVASADDVLSSPGLCGQILPSVELQIVDSHGQPVAMGTTGEVWIRGAMVAREYCSSAAPTLPSGWLRTGDIGRVDEADRLYIVDRKEDLVCLDHITISLTEFERQLSTHCAVADVAAAWCATAGRVGTLMIAVVLQRNSPLNKSQLEIDVGSIVKAFGVRSHVEIVESVPRSILGKVNRTELRRLLDEVATEMSSVRVAG